jgi:YD repeat-containing protein
MKTPSRGIVALFKSLGLAGLAMAITSAPVLASETITYIYDAKGRLIAVSHSGTPNNGVQTTYTYDAADNRTNVTVTGGSSGSSGGQGSGGASVPTTPVFVVVPLNGYSLIMIPPQ